MTKAKHKKIKLALYYNRYVPFKIYWGFILQTYIAYLNVYFLDKREMPELHYADLSDTMNTSLAPETEITTIREQVFNIIGLSNNSTTEMNTLEKNNLTMAEYPCSCTHTQLLAVLSVCTCIVFVISALLVWFLLEKKETQTGNEWRSVCSNTTAFPLRHSSKQNFVKDKLNPLAFKVISCTFYTILWFAMVCELSDMLWDCYAMLWYLYSIKIWNERLNDMVCYGMLCYAIRF